MARKSDEKTQASSNGDKQKARGPSSESQALRTSSLDEIMGVEALDFGFGVVEILTSKYSI